MENASNFRRTKIEKRAKHQVYLNLSGIPKPHIRKFRGVITLCWLLSHIILSLVDIVSTRSGAIYELFSPMV
jgi:hypothetical protein